MPTVPRTSEKPQPDIGTIVLSSVGHRFCFAYQEESDPIPYHFRICALQHGQSGIGLEDSVPSWRKVKPVVGVYNWTWTSTMEKSTPVNGGGGYSESVGVSTEAAKVAPNEDLAKRLWKWTEVELKDY
ncbi:hypothetical protein V5O48_009627 [Marasmius crinis-equi]|uniref:Uncharacterized protein n=1 Tax=Marasmius crinis-equi TaxID=585013 RepID=A0ABR3FB64_9AGAR